MDIKYCLPVIESDKDTIRRLINTNSSDYTYIEIWLDYIDNLDLNFCAEIKNKYAKKIVFLFRRQNLEKTQMDTNLKLEILASLKESESFVDLDISDQKNELEYCKKNNLNIKIICSYHNYKETPSDEKLNELLRQMEVYEPEIFKFACYCNEQSDSLRLMSFLINLKSRNKKFIILGMGEKGLITRLFGTKWGNEMIFAPLDVSKISAAGQYTKDKYEMIFKLLK